jgi:hypothetical protein
MIKILKIVVWVVWAVSMIGLGTLIGAAYGWDHHGWPGAIALGTVGFGVGALLATSPAIALEFLSAAT